RGPYAGVRCAQPGLREGAACSGRAQEIALANLDAALSQNRVDGRRMEIDIRHSRGQELLLAGERHRLAADLEGDVPPFRAIDLRRRQRLQKCDRLLVPPLELIEALLLVRILRQFDAGEPAGAALGEVRCELKLP